MIFAGEISANAGNYDPHVGWLYLSFGHGEQPWIIPDKDMGGGQTEKRQAAARRGPALHALRRLRADQVPQPPVRRAPCPPETALTSLAPTPARPECLLRDPRPGNVPGLRRPRQGPLSGLRQWHRQDPGRR